MKFDKVILKNSIMFTLIILLFLTQLQLAIAQEALPEIGVPEIKQRIIENSQELREISQSIDQLQEAVDQLDRLRSLMIMMGERTPTDPLKSGPYYNFIMPNFILPERYKVQLESLVTTYDTISTNLQYQVDAILSNIALLNGQVVMFDQYIAQAEKRYEVAKQSFDLGNISSDEMVQAELNLSNLKHNREKLINNIKNLELKLIYMTDFEFYEPIRIVGAPLPNPPLDLAPFEDYLQEAIQTNRTLFLNDIQMEVLEGEGIYTEAYKNFMNTSDYIDYYGRLSVAEADKITETHGVMSALLDYYQQLKLYENSIIIGEEKMQSNKAKLNDMILMKDLGLINDIDLMNFEIQLLDSELSLQNTVESRNLLYRKFNTLLNQGIMIQGGF